MKLKIILMIILKIKIKQNLKIILKIHITNKTTENNLKITII